MAGCFPASGTSEDHGSSVGPAQHQMHRWQRPAPLLDPSSPSGVLLGSLAGFVASVLDFSSGCVKAVACFHQLSGGAARAEAVGDVTEESLSVTSRTRGTLCRGAETSSPALCGSRFEGQHT